MFYRYLKDKSHKLLIKPIVNPYVTPLLSASSINHKCSPVNLNKQFIEPCTTPFPNNPYRKRITPDFNDNSSRSNNSVTHITKKKHKTNHNDDMSIKQSKQKIATKNNIFVRNKNITLPLKKRNEELKNINPTTK